MFSIPFDIEEKVREQSPKSKYNVFMYRMKKYNGKQIVNAINLQAQGVSHPARHGSPKTKNSVQKFLALGDRQEGQQEKAPNPTTSQNLRKTTLSPKYRKSFTNYTKKQNNFSEHMPEINQTQKNKNNLSIILSTSYKRPLWRSLQMYSPKKNVNIITNANASKCNIFKRNKQQNLSHNPQIQFCTTSNIFIFKKLKDKINQLGGIIDKRYDNSSNSVNIKYKNNTFKDEVIYGNSARLSSEKMRNFFYPVSSRNVDPSGKNQQKINKKMKEKIDESLIKPIRVKQDKNTFKALQNKFIEGVYGLEPWNIGNEDQGFTRISPLISN